MAAYVVSRMRALSATPEWTDIDKQVDTTHSTAPYNNISRLFRRDGEASPIAIVAIVAGCVIGFMVIGTCIMCCCKGRRSKSSGGMRHWADDPSRSRRQYRARRGGDVELNRWA
ncbi:hypothetical protein F4820DRAFT_443700 [Hypoxylon rubiginosum]|uniref:Uncharacterized protein n=1 Tax=Hypoxylon rubiginosum TaxID=110542 RepID=A0ACB9ZE46_9PEZI|nr:hypothetical protein F4820DRAFT_443700 [Hypoxylon rubiginosum]